MTETACSKQTAGPPKDRRLFTVSIMGATLQTAPTVDIAIRHSFGMVASPQRLHVVEKTEALL